MKSIYDFFIFRAIIVAFCVLGTVSIYAQSLEKECENIYIEFLVNRKGPELEKFQKAVVFGNEYLEKCGDLKNQETVKDYVTKQIPKIEKTIKEILDPSPDISLFNSSVTNKDWEKAFASGKELIKLDAHFSLDVLLTLASIGFDNADANPPNDKFNDEVISYAKLAVEQLNEGKISSTKDFGAFQYVYRTKDCLNGRLNATGWMNYIIGYIMYVRQKQANEALPYLYQAMQIGCETKKIQRIYELIGDWYFDEFNKTDNSAMQKGYANRALDAYARAYNIASQKHNPSFFIGSLHDKLKLLYPIVYNSDSTGLNEYLKKVTDTPFIDPATPVSPLPKSEQ